MDASRVDINLLKAVINVAKENCGRADWDDIEPSLAAAWEELRSHDTPPWEIVCDEVRATCKDSSLLR